VLSHTAKAVCTVKQRSNWNNMYGFPGKSGSPKNAVTIVFGGNFEFNIKNDYFYQTVSVFSQN